MKKPLVIIIKAIALMACLMSSVGAMAQEAYANLILQDSTLTFYYDDLRSSRPGYCYPLNTGDTIPYWVKDRVGLIVNHLVFDPSFAAARPTSTYGWFANMNRLTSITDIQYLNTSEVTTMRGMFHDCSSLTTLDLSGLNTSNVTTMEQMFYGCSSLTTLDLSGLNTPNVTTMELMFYGCSSLKSLNLSGLNTSKLKNMEQMFGKCTALTTLNLDGLNTANVTNMVFLFDNCHSLDSLDLSSFNTENVTKMVGMFIGCQSLKSIDLSSFNTGNVTSMNAMFYGCQSLTSVDLSGFNTSKVTEMDHMFDDCRSLVSVKLDGINTENVINMAYMFRGCSSLTSLDLSSFNTVAVTDMEGMFKRCSSLTSLDLSSFNTAAVNDMGEMFYGCSSLSSLNLNGLNTENVTSMNNMFGDCKSLTALDLSSFNTGNVTSMNGMFYGCTSLKSIDLSSLNTSNVDNMTSMFRDCQSLTALDLSSFNTGNVLFMPYMFMGCSQLETIYAGDGWSTDSVTQSSEMFSGCAHLVGGQGTTYDERQVDAARAHIDEGPVGPGYFSIKGGPAPSVAYAVLSADEQTLTFYYDAELSSRPGTAYVLNKAEPNPGWAAAVQSITWVQFDSTFVDARPVSTRNWFNGMSKLDSVTGISYLNTSLVTDMRRMFTGCQSLTALDLSAFNTENVTSMWAMFDGCDSLTALDLAGFNTAAVTSMARMFAGCKSLTTLDLSAFSTARVTDVAGMFTGCQSLATLGLGAFDTRNVKYMGWMFSGCQSLAALDLSGFNTSSVIEMEYMFQGCESLATLDLSRFNTSNVRNMQAMFDGCSHLQSIDAGLGWHTDAVIESSDMFRGCIRLVGGMGTPFDESHVDAAWARIDGGQDDPGYLTGKIVIQPGDVNADGEINIADVNCVINAIQTTADPYEGRADANDDGEVTVADINTIIDIILGGTTPTPPTPPVQEYVDLGLPSGTLWATRNIGANSPEEIGDYFAWGETRTKDYYHWSTYKWCNGEYNMTKYSTGVDNKTELDPEDDAAHVNWGPNWRMPSMEQQKELLESCTWTPDTLNGVAGYRVTGPNGNSIFLPVTLQFPEGFLDQGFYWSRTCYTDYPNSAFVLFFYSSSSSAHCTNSYRWRGLPVRAVFMP